MIRLHLIQKDQYIRQHATEGSVRPSRAFIEQAAAPQAKSESVKTNPEGKT